jgi:hypothetical protein
MKPMTCPICLGPLEEHCVHEDGRDYLLYFCDTCLADYLPVGMDGLVCLSAPHGTRPMPAVKDKGERTDTW